MKQIRLFLLGLVGIVCVQVSAYDFSAVAHDYWQDVLYEIELYYTINQDGKTVTVTNGPATYEAARVNIPETVEHEGVTYTVTAIGYQAFMNAKIGHVCMPNTVTEVLKEAFAWSTISSIKFSEGLKHIREGAFATTELENVILYSGVETIGDRAFYHETYGNPTWLGPLHSIELPNSITYIGKSCFLGQSIESIILPEKLEVIEENMFSRIVDVTLPKNLKKIASAAFYGCPISQIKFPSSLEVIEANAFRDCLFTEVTLPNSVKTVGEAAFAGNKQMTTITFSEGMTHLPSNVCSDCEMLVDVNIPEGVITIGENVFSNCKLLSHITFPESVETIGESALFSTGIVDFKFPKSVTKIPSSMFGDCNMLTEYTIPDNIKEIDRDAFYNCSNLRSIIIPASVTNIGASVFRNCTSLQEVEIPNSLTTLGRSMFGGCTSLQKVVLPEGFKILAGGDFNGCISLKEITLPESLEEIGSSSFANTGLTSIVIPSNVKKIYFQAFYKCESLAKVVIPHSVACMGGNMFYGCSKLEEVHYQRAILPEPTSYYESYRKIHPDNICTLYVPRGAKSVYEADENWNEFMAIVEEDVPNVYYELGAKVLKGKGTVTVGEQNVVSNKVDALLNSAVTVTFTPAEGYMIETVLCNGEDITSELSETLGYAIASVEANYQFEVYYKELPVVLHLVSGQGGSIDMQIEKGEIFACNFQPEEEWTINTIMFNGRDVTSEWNETTGYTTPKITSESTLSVSFELLNSVVSPSATRMKVYAKEKGLLAIEGLTLGEEVSIYTADGKLEKSFKCSSSNVNVSLPINAVYVVKTNNGVVKVGM